MNLHDFVEHLNRKPEHERQRIAFGASAAICLVILLGWGTALVSSGRLAFSTSEKGQASIAQNAGEQINQIAGAAAAFRSTVEDNGGLTVVGATTTSTFDQTDTGSATVISF